jgi:lipoprotein-anchoring transpeptidase ErfK/SrfK
LPRAPKKNLGNLQAQTHDSFFASNICPTHNHNKTMANKQPLKTSFDVDHVIRPIFTGGSVAIDTGARILATVLGEDAVLTDPTNGKHLAQIEGVSNMFQSK